MCLFFRIIKHLGEMTDINFEQFKPYINKQLNEEYKKITDRAINTIKYIR